MPLAVVVYNPLAGSGRADEVSERAARRVAAAGYEVERIPTRDCNGARPIAREVPDRFDLLVVCGGDGTLREAIEGLGEHRPRVAIGLVPMGNANVVARELGIPSHVDRALSILVDGKPVPMDIGRARGDAFEDIFLAVVGVGWDAVTVGILDRMRRTRPGRIAYRLWADGLYLLAGLLATIRPVEARFRLKVEGGDRDVAYCAACFCSVSSYGKGMVMAPGAEPASGLIHFQTRKRSFPLFLFWHLIAALRARRCPDWISDYGETRTVELRAEAPVSVEIDGDARGRTRSLQLSIEPSAVRILAPAAG